MYISLTLPVRKGLFYISFLSPFDNVASISLETIGHPQVVALKYLRMRKLQFPNAIYNLLTKFSIERGSSGFFFNFLICYDALVMMPSIVLFSQGLSLVKVFTPDLMARI